LSDVIRGIWLEPICYGKIAKFSGLTATQDLEAMERAGALRLSEFRGSSTVYWINFWGNGRANMQMAMKWTAGWRPYVASMKQSV